MDVEGRSYLQDPYTTAWTVAVDSPLPLALQEQQHLLSPWESLTPASRNRLWSAVRERWLLDLSNERLPRTTFDPSRPRAQSAPAEIKLPMQPAADIPPAHSVSTRNDQAVLSEQVLAFTQTFMQDPATGVWSLPTPQADLHDLATPNRYSSPSTNLTLFQRNALNQPDRVEGVRCAYSTLQERTATRAALREQTEDVFDSQVAAQRDLDALRPKRKFVPHVVDTSWNNGVEASSKDLRLLIAADMRARGLQSKSDQETQLDRHGTPLEVVLDAIFTIGWLAVLTALYAVCTWKKAG